MLEDAEAGKCPRDVQLNELQAGLPVRRRKAGICRKTNSQAAVPRPSRFVRNEQVLQNRANRMPSVRKKDKYGNSPD